MKNLAHITFAFVFAWCLQIPCFTHAQLSPPVRIDFCGDPISFESDILNYELARSPSEGDMRNFYKNVLENKFLDAVKAVKIYQQQHQPDDWLYYQLIRRTAQALSPKQVNYYQYTLFKWYLLTASGYDAILRISDHKVLFYVRCDENIYNIPVIDRDGKQYVCLNYHDYGNIDFTKETFSDVGLAVSTTEKKFSYKVTHVPDLAAIDYLEKDIHFTYDESDYHFKIKLSPKLESLFVNYPVVDYESYINIPLSKETYNTLIPQLKKNVKGMKVRNGVDYIMRFTRYAFTYQADNKHFGGEKRLSPEQTLFYNESDCDDRVALFFYLVKEIYDLPMIVISFPTHVTVGVQFDKAVGRTITYQGKIYTICEPTSQSEDLLIGELSPEFRKTPYEIAYAYKPTRK